LAGSWRRAAGTGRFLRRGSRHLIHSPRARGRWAAECDSRGGGPHCFFQSIAAKRIAVVSGGFTGASGTTAGRERAGGELASQSSRIRVECHGARRRCGIHANWEGRPSTPLADRERPDQLSRRGCYCLAQTLDRPLAAGARALITHGHADMHARAWRLLGVGSGEGAAAPAAGPGDPLTAMDYGRS